MREEWGNKKMRREEEGEPKRENYGKKGKEKDSRL